MAWIGAILLLAIGLSSVESELTNGCMREGHYFTTTFWCPSSKKIFVLESYKGCSHGDLTPRCENRTADHFTCEENRALLTDVFRKGCNGQQRCNFNQFLPNVPFQGNLRFYVWFTCTEISPTAQTLPLTSSSGTANSNQIIMHSTNYPEGYEEARAMTFQLIIPDEVRTVSLEVKELLEESGAEYICFTVENAQLRKSMCSESGGEYSTLFLPNEGNEMWFGPPNISGRIRYYIIVTALDGNQISTSKIQLSYFVDPPVPSNNNNPVIPPNQNNGPTIPPPPQPAIPDPPSAPREPANTPQPPLPVVPQPLPTPAPQPVPNPPPAPPPLSSDQQVTEEPEQATTMTPADVLPLAAETSDGIDLPPILGGVAGGFIFLIVLLVLIVCLAARRKKSASPREDTNPKVKTVSSDIEYYPTAERVSHINPSKNLNVCEYYQVSDSKAKDKECYYEVSPPGTAVRPPPHENHYSELKPPPVFGVNNEDVRAALYSKPQRDQHEMAPLRPYVPQGAVRVF